MEPSHRFRVGDRVRTTRPVLGLPIGSLGTIGLLVPFGDYYDVRFDGQTESQFLQRRALELVRPEELSREVSGR